MHYLRHRLNREEGFTLIELLVVIVIIGILLAIAVPSYLTFKGRAESKSAAANVRSSIPAAEAFYSDNGTYTGMTKAALLAIDSGLPSTLVVFGSGSGYCISDHQGSKYAKVVGPGGTIDDTVAANCASAAG
jgi:type IV pilus assembly protein PilA